MKTENYKVCTVETSSHKKPRLTAINEVLSTHSESSAIYRFNALVKEGKKAFVALLDGQFFKRYKAKNFDEVYLIDRRSISSYK